MRRIFYRVEQFRQSFFDAPGHEGVQRAQENLDPALFDLFGKMLPFEQAHALRVFDRLQEQGFSQPDLLAAGLLHDVGKTLYPLRPWERGLGVLAKKFFPRRIQQWGKGKPGGLRSGIVVGEQHAHWGAQMAQKAGASVTVVQLIEFHQSPIPSHLSEEVQELLKVLQSVDEVS